MSTENNNEEEFEYQQIELTSEDGEKENFYVLEQTRVNETVYLLVTDDIDDSEEEGDAFILKEVSSEDEEGVYEFVEDENEIAAVGKIFAELMDDDIVF